ncbi:MAG TPA: hypothetical protein ENK82_02440 [Campylobacterales bacterium]|nr:hypothetical protein [Campylobacterales bacterium]HHS92184.1 hypothetical protein [Campylobacterales bacterium]
MKSILLFIVLLFLTACETGTKYETNRTKSQLDDLLPSGVVDRKEPNDKIEALIEEDEELSQFDEEIHTRVLEEDRVVASKTNFSAGKIQDGLDIKEIREGKHEDYVRLVFDIYEKGVPADQAGYYNAKYYPNKDEIEVVITGYRKFSASLPSFSETSPIEQIYFGTYRDDSGFKFHIKLRHKSKVRVFDLKQPARLVFDIKPI